MARYLITGGAGFIGSHLCEHFLGQGHEVICMDNYSTGAKENIGVYLKNPRFRFIDHNVSRYIEVQEPLDYVLSLSEAALAEMRALIFELRPESLETEGLVAALEKQAASLRARHHFDVRLTLEGEPRAPLEVKQALYRIAQEALHNVVKHARASRVDLVLQQTEAGLRLDVCDNGRGFEAGRSFPGHLGLRSMRERAEKLGGVLEITSAPGEGAHICVRLPNRTAQDELATTA